MIAQEQFVAASRAQLDTLIGLGTKTFEGFEKLVELNLQAVKTSLAEAADALRAALGAKDPAELLSIQTGFVQPVGEKAAAYSRHVYDIVTATTAEFARVYESTLAETQRNVLAFIDSASQNAPVGGGNAATLFKSSLAAASSAYESVNKAAKQASDVARANILALTSPSQKAQPGKVIVAA